MNFEIVDRPAVTNSNRSKWTGVREALKSLPTGKSIAIKNPRGVEHLESFRNSVAVSLRTPEIPISINIDRPSNTLFVSKRND